VGSLVKAPPGTYNHVSHRDNVTAPYGRPKLRSRLHFSHNREWDHEDHQGHVVVLAPNQNIMSGVIRVGSLLK
jgi:hypothetical protein